jgi:hypothetical protein
VSALATQTGRHDSEDHRLASAPPGTFSARERAFMIGVPLLWGILLLFHPAGDGTAMYRDLHDQVTPMLVVHIGMLLFLPLMAVVMYALLRGVDGTAARISRLALVPFVVFYGAWEALQGIANGILVDQVNGLPEAQRATAAGTVQDFAESILVRDGGVLGSIGSLAFITAAIAAGIALRRAGAALWVAVLLGLAGFLITAHPPPFGPTGLALFIVAIVLLMRREPAARATVSSPARPRQFAGPTRAFGPAEVAFLIGVPLLWAVLLLFHPTGDGEEFYPVVRDQVTAFQLVHIGTLLFVPLLACVVYLLLRGVEGTAARVSRMALAVFALLYTAWEVLIGIGVGVLVEQVNELPAAGRATGARLVEDYAGSPLISTLEPIATTAWLIAAVAAGVALFRRTDARSSSAVVVLLLVSAIPISWHVPPFGPAGLALFITATVLVLRGRSAPALRAHVPTAEQH